jgi:endonuclease/exonuclease/phosphatase family metal-dependent hydrolase
MTYNIKGASYKARAASNFTFLDNLQGIAQVIAAQNPDVVVLQEVDKGWLRSEGRDQVSWLGEKLGYHAVFGRSFSIKQADGTMGEYGNGLLSRHPISSWRVQPLWRREYSLPNEPSWVIEPRTCLIAEILAEKPIVTMGLHLSTTSDQREQQLRQMSEIIRAEKSKPLILMGDFNAQLPELTASAISGELTCLLGNIHGFTFPNGMAAKSAIDYIWVSDHWRVDAVWVVSELQDMSDHNPVVADLTLV